MVKVFNDKKAQFWFILLVLTIVVGRHSPAALFAQAIMTDNMASFDRNGETEVDTSARPDPLKINVLPFALYSEIFKWAVGGFVGMRGLTEGNASVYLGGLVSTNGTKYGFLQFRDFYLPFAPRFYFEPDILGGYFGVLRVYKEMPASQSAPSDYKAPPGSNESDKDDYMEVSGSDQWYELNIRYLLPIGHGKDQVRFAPVLKKGILQAGETGATDWKPLNSGRTFIDLMPFYRKRVNFTTAGIELALTYENMDFAINPTKGNFAKVVVRRDWGGFGSSAPWTIISSDWRLYFPLNEIFNAATTSLPKILALNLWTVNTLTWDSYHIQGTYPDGSPKVIFHRPPPYTGAFLGGRYHLRAYYEGRFSDRAALYFGAEYRQILDWNPFNSWALTKKLNIQWLQVALFIETGRVAPEWKFSLLSKDLKYDAGGGLRFMMGNLILRLDGAFSPEGFYTQMYVDHAF